ncbi:MAG: hypothetical protein ACR2NA_01850 [Solirubrobacterales bacterium]
MRLDVGPVAPACAIAWLGWADEVYDDLGNRPTSTLLAPTGLSVDVVSYLHRWTSHAGGVGKIYRWQAEVEPDELEYLVHAFCSLDAQMSAEGVAGEQPPVPEEGRAFYLVLVGALLHALETESRSRAAFVDQLRSCWPSAAEAN